MKKAVVLPAYNEETTVEQVVVEFHTALPDAEIFVINNNSSDQTAHLAAKAIAACGAIGSVLTELRQGKGHAIRKGFMEIDADIYIMADADLTYSAADVLQLMQPILAGTADMVVGNRHHQSQYSRENKRPLHQFGNHLVKSLINWLFHADLQDIMSGYRVFNRRFVKNFPVLCPGFQLETEMTLHALDKRFRIVENPIHYQDRPQGSFSKLHTFSDGIRVLFTIFEIFRHYRPFLFFNLFALLFFIAGLSVGTLPILEYLQFQYVFRVPLAILACGLVICALLFMAIGFILDSTVRNHRFEYELRLLSQECAHSRPTATPAKE